MEILQEIGSYAGLAAVLGLAVLSALYFSQARDVKRLREWAGRAPERAPETTGVQGVIAKPVPRAPGQAVASAPAAARPPASPGARPVPPAPTGARAAAAGAAPATAVGPAAATPAARADAAAKAGEGQDAEAPRTGNGADDPPLRGAGNSALSQDTVVHPPPGEDDADDFEDADDLEDDADFDDTGEGGQVSEGDDWEDTGERDAPDPEAHWDETGDQPAVAPRPVTPAASRPIAPGAPVPAAGTPAPAPSASASAGSSGGGSILPPYAHSRPGGRAADGGNGQGVFASRGRAIAAVAAAMLILGGLVLGATQLLGGDEEPARSGGGSPGNAENAGGEGGDKQANRPRRPNPRNVRVAVLNGTTVPGLAAQIGDQIERQGFRLGTVTNFNDQQRAESVVLYAPGAEREAAEVGRRLKIAQREPIDAESQSVAGDATVVVVTGQDKTQ